MGCRSICLLLLLSASGTADVRQPPNAWFRENSAAGLFLAAGRYADARLHYEAARRAAESLGTSNTLLADTLNNLGTVCDYLGEALTAERYYRQSIRMWETAGGPASSGLAAARCNLATVYLRRGQNSKAIDLYQQALEIPIVPSDPRLIGIRDGLAVALTRARRYREAQQLLEESLALAEKHLGENASAVAVTLNHLAVLHQQQGRAAQTLPMLERAVSIWKNARIREQRGMIEPLNNLGAAHCSIGRYAEAAADLSQALEIAERRLPAGSPDTADILRNYAWVLRKLKRKSEAKQLEARAARIQQQHSREYPSEYTIDVRNLESFRSR